MIGWFLREDSEYFKMSGEEFIDEDYAVYDGYYGDSE